MKAMCFDANKDFVWRDVPDPACHDGFDVKIRIRACAINRGKVVLEL